MNTLLPSKRFKKRFKEYTAKNDSLKKKIFKAIIQLEEDPFYPSLKTHKVLSRHDGIQWSSWVTGDVRIIWGFDTLNPTIIHLITLGKHSGSDRIYH